ncbi:MAG: hypothetical protein K2F68_04670, partial [Duncaniella sp.]|nr:hypothetical protein [Duncaniella sp.]
MTPDYKKMLHMAYEIEGLLLVQMDRPERHSAELNSLIAEKTSALNALAEAMAKTTPAESASQEIAQAALEEEAGDACVETTVEETPAPAPTPAPNTIQNPVQTTESTPTPAPVPTPVQETETVASTLDERIARDRAKDIFKAFTLNDKFRFRRELFRNSQAEFDDTLGVVSAMTSIEEAEEYFY